MSEIDRPEIVGRCKVCRVTTEDVDANKVVVSPAGVAHFTEDHTCAEFTACGKDATGEFWWWPL